MAIRAAGMFPISTPAKGKKSQKSHQLKPMETNARLNRISIMTIIVLMVAVAVPVNVQIVQR